mmetsp:Transcript_52449/g.147207  ORF Transcript_52449/g.147207 Transcript_52449/m.147207 type:complete len:258 (-) Transcript_52449:299-1072(-)
MPHVGPPIRRHRGATRGEPDALDHEAGSILDETRGPTNVERPEALHLLDGLPGQHRRVWAQEAPNELGHVQRGAAEVAASPTEHRRRLIPDRQLRRLRPPAARVAGHGQLLVEGLLLRKEEVPETGPGSVGRYERPHVELPPVRDIRVRQQQEPGQDEVVRGVGHASAWLAHEAGRPCARVLDELVGAMVSVSLVLPQQVVVELRQVEVLHAALHAEHVAHGDLRGALAEQLPQRRAGLQLLQDAVDVPLQGVVERH